MLSGCAYLLAGVRAVPGAQPCSTAALSHHGGRACLASRPQVEPCKPDPTSAKCSTHAPQNVEARQLRRSLRLLQEYDKSRHERLWFALANRLAASRATFPK